MTNICYFWMFNEQTNHTSFPFSSELNREWDPITFFIPLTDPYFTQSFNNILIFEILLLLLSVTFECLMNKRNRQRHGHFSLAHFLFMPPRSGDDITEVNAATEQRRDRKKKSNENEEEKKKKKRGSLPVEENTLAVSRALGKYLSVKREMPTGVSAYLFNA